MFWFGRNRPDRLKDFQHELRRGRLARRYQRGLIQVPVAKVVGSVGKAASLDRRFLPRDGEIDARLRHLRRVNEWGMCALPPVDLYQLGDEYYVVDGHHRLAVALENRQVEIDAYVTVFELEPEAAPAYAGGRAAAAS
jgi:hypothetical protein